MQVLMKIVICDNERNSETLVMYVLQIEHFCLSKISNVMGVYFQSLFVFVNYKVNQLSQSCFTCRVNMLLLFPSRLDW